MNKKCITGTCRDCESLVFIEMDYEQDLEETKMYLNEGDYIIKYMDIEEAKSKLSYCKCNKFTQSLDSEQEGRE